MFRTPSALLAPPVVDRQRRSRPRSQPHKAVPTGEASLGRDKNGRWLAAVKPVDDIGRVEGPASAALVGRNQPQQGDWPGDVGDATKRHLYCLAGEDDGVAGSRSCQGEISIEVG